MNPPPAPPHDPERVRALFQAALERREEERAAFLAQACGSDAGLREELHSLLCAAATAKAFLEREPARAALDPGLTRAPAPAAFEAAEDPPRIPGYESVREIHRGGQGVVHEAYQLSTRRKVAIKVLLEGAWASPLAMRRFEREVELAAALRHPNIITVFDSGVTPEGLRYCVMDFVPGLPLDRHARERSLDRAQVLRLFLTVCAGVSHAHQRGVIHRDLKPSNILVDAEGAPRILDFGLAKLVLGPPDPLTTLTGQVVGTVHYLSPEQTRGDPHDIDVRSDVYSLGVILYELVTGREPYSTEGSLGEALRNIVEAAPQRCPELDADLEIILLKALAKERERRYQSVGELGRDLERYLAQRPIEARRDSFWYVAAKTVRRHRLAASAALGFVALLVVATVALTAMYRRQLAATGHAVAALDAAERERLRANRELRSSNIDRARLFGEAGTLGAAEELLWREHLRQPEPVTFWALWELYSRNHLLASIQAHRGIARALVMAGGGARVVTAGDDAAIRLWDVDSLALEGELRAGAGVVHALALSPDERLLASAHGDGSIVLWDLAAGRSLRSLRGHEGEVRSLAFHPGGRRLASAGADGLVQVWDVATGQPLVRHEGQGADQWRVRYAPDGRRLAAADGQGRIRLWPDPPTGREVFAQAHEGPAVALTFSADGRKLISGGADRLIRTWDLAGGKLTPGSVVSRPNGTVRALEPSRDRRLLASGGWYRLELWDADSLAWLRSMPVPDSAWAVGFGRGDRMVAVVDTSGGLRLWDTAPEAGRLRLPGHQGGVVGAFSPDGRWIATGDETGKARLWDARHGREAPGFASRAAALVSIAFDPQGRRAALASRDGTLRLCEVPGGACAPPLTDHAGAGVARSVQWSPDGARLAYSSSGGTIAIVAGDTGQELARLDAATPETLGVRFSPDGRILAATGRGPSILLWSAAGEPLAPLATRRTPWTLSFSHDGRKLATGTWGREVEVWDLARREREALLVGHNGVVWDVAFRPGDADLLASAAGDGTVKLWQVSSGRCLLTLDAFPGLDVRSIDWNPEGSSLMAAGRDPSVLVWDLDYFDRHIAGNLAFQLERVEQDPELGKHGAQLRAWAVEVRKRAWPRRAGGGPDQERAGPSSR